MKIERESSNGFNVTCCSQKLLIELAQVLWMAGIHFHLVPGCLIVADESGAAKTAVERFIELNCPKKEVVKTKT